MIQAPDFKAPRTRAERLTDRALHFIQPPSRQAMAAKVIVAIALRNQASALPRALSSVFLQDIPASELAVLVLDDGSNDDWQDQASELLKKPNVIIAQGRCGTPAQARNALLDLVDRFLPAARWVARLDADDALATASSLRRLVEAGDRAGAQFVLGSNYLSTPEGQCLESPNIADPAVLLDPAHLTAFIDAFTTGQTWQELPSCNLLLRAGSGIRYPLVRSAEDHWLVASLLMFHANKACVVPTPIYSIYTLQGHSTRSNRYANQWQTSRAHLQAAAAVWHKAVARGHSVLGWGQEGVVWQSGQNVVKCFYQHAMSHDELLAIQQRAKCCASITTPFDIHMSTDGALLAIMPWRDLKTLAGRISADSVLTFLKCAYHAGVVPGNIKRDNLRFSEKGQLVYIDVGRDLVELTLSRFLDCAARLYAIAIMGWSDFELSRRSTEQTEIEALGRLEGFPDFYRRLIMALHPAGLLPVGTHKAKFDHPDVTLMIKCCPQDAAVLSVQVRHIVGSLCQSTRFGRCVLLIDGHEGPYLRQYAPSDLTALMSQAQTLQCNEWVDELWMAPRNTGEILALYQRWFGRSTVTSSHTTQGAPLFPQLWGFEKVTTRFVLQVDVDVLIGISDPNHDVIGEMKRAMLEPAVWSVGFNIPKAKCGFRLYTSPEAGFVPEIRMGLLDLSKILSRRPFANPVLEGRYKLMWHRLLECAQPIMSMRSLRGGDSRSFYCHPLNTDKGWSGLPMARDLVGQGSYPKEQADHWDMVSSANWAYEKRHEDLVFMLLGRDTPTAKLKRCLASLEMQTIQNFGVVIIDDGGNSKEVHSIHNLLGKLRERTTLIRRNSRVGYLANFRTVIQEICSRSETLIVVLDQDDALMASDVAERLWSSWSHGADLINAPMFRPDKPLALYPVTYDRPRLCGGGNVWAHLRAFRKSLFDLVPSTAWLPADEEFDCLSDYRTMVPMAELAKNPVSFNDRYYYLHERDPYPVERKHQEIKAKRLLFSQPELHIVMSG